MMGIFGVCEALIPLIRDGAINEVVPQPPIEYRYIVLHVKFSASFYIRGLYIYVCVCVCVCACMYRCI